MEKHEVSLFGYYVQAALVAARMGIGLDYAFRRYVKPAMPQDGGLMPFTHEEAKELLGEREPAQ